MLAKRCLVLLAGLSAAAVMVSCEPSPDPAEQTEAVSLEGASEGPPRRRPVARLGSARADRGDLKLVYGELNDADHQELENVFREERFFEAVIDELNASLVLPRNLEIRLDECEEVNAFYDPEARGVTLCYELLTHFLELFGNQLEAQTEEEWEEVGGKAVAALVFVFYHELGHALVDVYDLPVTGREEDAVDQLATVMLLETWEGEDSELAILSSAEWFDLDAQEAAEEELDMADEHSLDEQRYYNLVCWIYGSDPEYFAELADEWGLPAERAERCAGEYEQMSAAWDKLLGPHLQPSE